MQYTVVPARTWSHDTLSHWLTSYLAVKQTQDMDVTKWYTDLVRCPMLIRDCRDTNTLYY